MKRIVSLAVCLLLLCACAPTADKPGELTFSAQKGDLFPFYCADTESRVWRVERDRAVCLGLTVEKDAFFSYFAARDIAVFACGAHYDAGRKLCSLVAVRGSGEAATIAENVLASSIRANANGALLYLDARNTLFCFSGGKATEIDRDAAQAEFLDGDVLLYRSGRGTYTDGEFRYPVYAAAADFKRYLADASEIAAVEGGRAYLIRERRLVQKRTAQAAVALCSVCNQSDVLFELPAVPVSQFDSSPIGPYLLVCDEDAPTLQYALCRTDGSEPVTEAGSVLAGRTVSSDGSAYAYEAVRGGIIERRLLIAGAARSLDSAACPLEAYFVCGTHVYRLENGVLYEDDEPLASPVALCRPIGADLLVFSATVPPYAVSLCRGGVVTSLAGDASDEKWDGKTLWYNSVTDGGLTVADETGKRTAVLSNIDTGTGFLCAGRSAAAVKDGLLYLACEGQLVRLDLPVGFFLHP